MNLVQMSGSLRWFLFIFAQQPLAEALNVPLYPWIAQTGAYQPISHWVIRANARGDWVHGKRGPGFGNDGPIRSAQGAMGPKRRESGREWLGHPACTIAITWRCGLMIERPGFQANHLLFISHRETPAQFVWSIFCRCFRSVSTTSGAGILGCAMSCQRSFAERCTTACMRGRSFHSDSGLIRHLAACIRLRVSSSYRLRSHSRSIRA